MAEFNTEVGQVTPLILFLAIHLVDLERFSFPSTHGFPSLTSRQPPPFLQSRHPTGRNTPLCYFYNSLMAR